MRKRYVFEGPDGWPNAGRVPIYRNVNDSTQVGYALLVKVEDVEEEKVARCVSVMDHVRLQCPTCKEYTVKPQPAPLKPCRCGSVTICLMAGWFWIAGCQKCGAWDSSDVSREKAIEKWNRRA